MVGPRGSPVNVSPAADAGPLAGLRVLDLSRHLAGPFAAMTLGDMGADVIKVERPGEGDDARGWPPTASGESCYFMSINRNKRSLVLDLSDPESVPRMRRLVETSDVLIENFRPGGLARLGYPDATLATWNTRLVHCAISAFGLEGPARDRPGMDLLLQASGGLMSITGEEGRPPVRVGISLVDLIAGSTAVNGILAALLERERSGTGQRVDVALQDGLLAWMSYHVTSFLMTGQEPTRMGASHASVAPYGAYPTADGYLVLAVGTDALWRDLCAALGLEVDASDPRFARNADRCLHRAALDALISERLAERTAEAWALDLGGRGVPCSPVRSLAEVLAEETVRSRGLIQPSRRADGTTIPAPAIPARLSRTPGSIRRPPPLLGEHTLEIIDELADQPPGETS